MKKPAEESEEGGVESFDPSDDVREEDIEEVRPL